MLIPSGGTGQFSATAAKVVRFVRMGCANRPFFHIVVTETKTDQYDPVIEQLGTYDPLPNEQNEKLVSLNLERIRHWIGNGAELTTPVAQLLGLAGFYPIHPSSYIAAWRNRRAIEEAKNQRKLKELEEKKVENEREGTT